MRTFATLLLVLALLPSAAVAQPPHVGAKHTFTDPLFEGTVFCDTYEQVREIATAERPQDVFLMYMQLINAKAEPTCATLTPTGTVVAVKPIGLMEEGGFYFQAYSVETLFGNIVAFALYLEKFDMFKL